MLCYARSKLDVHSVSVLKYILFPKKDQRRGEATNLHYCHNRGKSNVKYL